MAQDVASLDEWPVGAGVSVHPGASGQSVPQCPLAPAGEEAVQFFCFFPTRQATVLAIAESCVFVLVVLLFIFKSH